MHPNISPTALAKCRAALIQTTDTLDLNQIRHAWATLNAARGKQVQPANLGAAHHLITPDTNQHPSAPDAATMAEVQARAHTKTLACIRARGITPLSDLDGAA